MKGSRGKIWQESTKQEGKIEHLVSGLAGLGCLLDWTVGGLVGFVVLLVFVAAVVGVVGVLVC